MDENKSIREPSMIDAITQGSTPDKGINKPFKWEKKASERSKSPIYANLKEIQKDIQQRIDAD